jgi:hypothetical protein
MLWAKASHSPSGNLEPSYTGFVGNRQKTGLNFIKGPQTKPLEKNQKALQVSNTGIFLPAPE